MGISGGQGKKHGGSNALEATLQSAIKNPYQKITAKEIKRYERTFSQTAKSHEHVDPLRRQDVTSNTGPLGQHEWTKYPGGKYDGGRRLLTANESSSRSMKPYQAMMLLCVIAGFIQM